MIKGRFVSVVLSLLLAISPPTTAAVVERAQTQARARRVVATNESIAAEVQYKNAPGGFTVDAELAGLVETDDEARVGKTESDAIQVSHDLSRVPSALVDTVATERSLVYNCSPYECDTQPCVFPFIYKGVTYNSCTSVDNDDYLWCATETLDGNYVDGMWKDCCACDVQTYECIYVGTYNSSETVDAVCNLVNTLNDDETDVSAIDVGGTKCSKADIAQGRCTKKRTRSLQSIPSLEPSEGYIFITARGTLPCKDLKANLDRLNFTCESDVAATTCIVDRPSLRRRSAQDQINHINKAMAMGHVSGINFFSHLDWNSPTFHSTLTHTIIRYLLF